MVRLRRSYLTSSTAPTQVSLNVFVWPEGGSTKRNEDEEKVDEEDKGLVVEDKDEVDKKWKCEDELEENKGRYGVEKVEEDKDAMDRDEKTGIVLHCC